MKECLITVLFVVSVAAVIMGCSQQPSKGTVLLHVTCQDSKEVLRSYEVDKVDQELRYVYLLWCFGNEEKLIEDNGETVTNINATQVAFTGKSILIGTNIVYEGSEPRIVDRGSLFCEVHVRRGDHYTVGAVEITELEKADGEKSAICEATTRVQSLAAEAQWQLEIREMKLMEIGLAKDSSTAGRISESVRLVSWQGKGAGG